MMAHDIQEDNDGLVECYFGHFIVNGKNDEVAGFNIVIPNAESYEEAVGAAYLLIVEEYLNEELSLVRLDIEEYTIFVGSDDIID